jgi:NAD(P)-dependent dehydrogenase (short-subunit alcohol dehydrogenase family)
MELQLSNKVAPKTAVVTGSSQGLGQAIAQALLERGINVIVCSPSLASCRTAISGFPPGNNAARAFPVSCDIRSRRSLKRLRRIAEEKFGAIDLWVNNAGLALTGPDLVDLPEEDWRQMIEVNLTGTLLASQVAIEALKDRGGAIYNILGAGADGIPVPRMGGYATTKAGLTFLTQSLAQELSGSQITVSGLSPGLIVTRGFLREHAKLPDAKREEREKVVNLIADHPHTAGRWAAKIIDTNRSNGRFFNWLTPVKIERRRRLKKPRDILSRYRT